MARPKEIWHDFVVRPENQMAERAVKTLVKSVSKSMRPSQELIVLHGPTGCGKTTLVSAACKELEQKSMVMTAKDLSRQTDIVDALLSPMLVIEDIHFLPADSAERVVTILDSRASRRRATVVTSNVSPAELKILPQRLSNRLTGGLVVAFQPLSPESRVNIAESLAKKMNLGVSKKALREAVDSNVGGTVRQTLGAIQKDGRRPRLPVTTANERIEEIGQRVAKALGTTLEEMRGPNQFRNLSTARQLVAKLAYDHYGVSYRQLEAYFDRGGLQMARNHLAMKLLHDSKLKIIHDRLEQESKSLKGKRSA